MARRLVQGVENTVTIWAVGGSSRHADQNLLFSKENIKGRKTKFWLVGRQNPSSRVFIRHALHGNLHTYQIKYNTDSQVYKANNARKSNKWVDEPRSKYIQYSILQHTSRIDSIGSSYKNNIYDNYIRNWSRQLKPS